MIEQFSVVVVSIESSYCFEVDRFVSCVGLFSSTTSRSQPFLPLHGEPKPPTNTSTFYGRLQRFLNPSDLLVVDADTCQLQIKALRLPADVASESQTLWGSIGWATPAALGCDLVDPNRRVVMVTGDGGHQLTAQDIGVMGFVGSNPVVIVLNNDIYGIEVLISETGLACNNLPKWRYCDLPHVMGCEGWWTGRVSTISELEKAFEEINRHSCGPYLEVMIPQEENKPLAHDLIETFHKTTTPEIDENQGFCNINLIECICFYLYHCFDAAFSLFFIRIFYPDGLC